MLSRNRKPYSVPVACSLCFRICNSVSVSINISYTVCFCWVFKVLFKLDDHFAIFSVYYCCVLPVNFIEIYFFVSLMSLIVRLIGTGLRTDLCNSTGWITIRFSLNQCWGLADICLLISFCCNTLISGFSFYSLVRYKYNCQTEIQDYTSNLLNQVCNPKKIASLIKSTFHKPMLMALYYNILVPY